MNFTRELALLAAAALAWFAFALTISQPDMASPLVADIARTAALVLGGVLGARAVGLLLLDGMMERLWGVPANALIRLVVYMVLSFVATALVLKFGLDLDLTTLLTTSALLTAILGFAMQSTLAAFFSGLALQMERHIRPGDGIVVANMPATVETIGWRSMTARRSDGSLIMVPNTAIAAGPMPIRRPGELIRTSVAVAVSRSAPPAMVVDILCDAVAQLPGLAADRAVDASLVGIRDADELADYQVAFYSRPGVPSEQPMAALARLRVWYALQRHGLVPRDVKIVIGAGGPTPSAASAYSLPLPENLRIALAASRRWRDLAGDEQERLSGCGRRLLFAPEEPILLPRDLDGAIALVVAGEVRLAGESGDGHQVLEPPVREASDPGAVRRWDMEALLGAEARLAVIIGPYARRAVRRAADETGDIAALHERLAGHIEDAAARQAYLGDAPRTDFRDFGAGTTFVARCSGRGPAAPATRLIAVDHVEILAVPVGRADDCRERVAAEFAIPVNRPS